MVLVQFVHILLGLLHWYTHFFGDWQYGLISGALIWTLGGTLFLIALGWILRLVGVEYDLQKKEAAYRKIPVIAEDDGNVRPKTIDELFDDVPVSPFLSYIRYRILMLDVWRTYKQTYIAYVFLAPIVAGVVTLGVMQQIIHLVQLKVLQYLLKAWPNNY